jgi:hypothetical protein
VAPSRTKKTNRDVRRYPNLIPTLIRVRALHGDTTMFVAAPNETAAVDTVVPNVDAVAIAGRVVADVMCITALPVTVRTSLASMILASFNGPLLTVGIHCVLVVEVIPAIVMLDVVL